MYLKEKFEKDILFIDELTQIFNYRFYSRILPQILKNSKNSIFVIFDIDNFKKINDTYGHKFGDIVLKKISENLKTIFKEKNEFPIRYAGDEFVIIIFDIEKEKGITKAKEMFEKISNLKFFHNGKEIEVSLSCGISFYPEDAISLEELFKKADDALYYVKRRGKNNFIIYSQISYIMEKEKILKSELTPKDIIGFKEEKNLIEAVIKEKRGIFIIQGKSGVGKTKFLKYIEKELLEKNFLTIMSFTIKNDKFLPFNVFLRGINFWLDERRMDLLKEKGLGNFLKYFPISGGESEFSMELENFFEFLEKFLLSFDAIFLIDDALNMDKYSTDFIELMKDRSLFFLSISDIKYIKPSLMEKGILIRLSNIPTYLVKDYIENILPGFTYPPEFLEWLKINSENNPFLIEEIIRYLIEKDYIKISKDKFELEGTSEILFKKISLNEIIKERIKTLDEETKSGLYSLSIGERYFDIDTARKYIGINYGKMVDLMKKLIEKSFVSKISEDIYFFRSSLTKDMIYQNIPEEIKKRLHFKMAKALEESKILPGFLREPEILKHYKMAGEIKKAKEVAEKINEFLQKLKNIPDLKKLIKIRKRNKIKKELQILPLKKELISDAHLFLKKFYSSIEAVKIYPPNSPTLIERVKETYEALKNILSIQKNLIIGIHEGKLLINEFEIIEEKAYIKKIKELIEEMRIESIIFTEEIETESMHKFLTLTKEIKGWILKGKSVEEEIEKENLKGIYVNERIYVALEIMHEDVFELEKLETGEFEELPHEEILEVKEHLEEKIKKFIHDKEKLKEIIDENLIKFESKNFEEQKNLLNKIENIYSILPEEIKYHVSKKLLKIYSESENIEIKTYLKEKIFFYIEKVVLKEIEELKKLSEKEPEIIIENLEKLIKMEERLENDKKSKLKKFIIEFAKKEFNQIIKVLRKELLAHSTCQEILKEKIIETDGYILKENFSKEIIYEMLNIIEREDIKVNFLHLLDLYKKSVNKEISFELFKILKEKKIELLKKYFEECLKNRNEEEIERILIFIEKMPDEEFMPYIIEIIKKKKKIEKDFSYRIQLKSLEIIKKIGIEKYVDEIMEIAKKEKIFSIKKEKPAFIRFEIIKILTNYLKEKNKLSVLKIFESDKNKTIKLFIKKNLYGE
ncbi:MAG: diguanylate cyclase [candidate division WOR-3 bacterium]